jgi:hypothetical protein
MTYTAPSSNNFLKSSPGTDASIIRGELVKVATELGTLATADTTSDTAFANGVRVAKVRAAGAAQNAQSFAWQNPESTKIIIFKAILHVFDAEDVGVGTLMDIGVAANGTTSSDTLLDGVAITATGLFDNITNKGTSGKPQVIVDEKNGTNDYVTGTVNTATGASFTGCVYLFYTKVGFLE